MPKLYVTKPHRLKGKWVIRVVDSPSPFAKTIEEIPFDCYADAARAYPQVKRENGDWY